MKTNFGFVKADFDGSGVKFYPGLYNNIRYTCEFPSCCGANMHLNTAGKVNALDYAQAVNGIFILEGEHQPLEKDEQNKIVHTVVQTKNGPITVRVRQ